MTTPPFLSAGDTIAICAPARRISPDDLKQAINTFGSWGLSVVTSPNIHASDNQFAGTDEQRAADLQLLLDDETIKAIVFARGGYGIVRIIDRLDFTSFARKPKWLIGYSDITVLHSHISRNFGIETLHATMPVNFNDSSEETSESIDSMRKVLFGETPVYELVGHLFNRQGEAQGILTGGNLSILYSLLGSASDVDTSGKVLFIEDLDEYLYHIDRMMQSLKRAGKLDNLSALVVGGMSGMRDNEVPFGKTAEEIVRDVVEEYKYPVIYGFPAGHQLLNKPLILGREVTVSAGTTGKVVFKEPVPRKGFRRYRNLLKPAAFVIGGFILLYVLYALLLGRL